MGIIAGLKIVNYSQQSLLGKGSIFFESGSRESF
jgi:hypothetical protein